jgi:hypothetical protein
VGEKMNPTITFETPEGTSTKLAEEVEYDPETYCWAVKMKKGDADGYTYIPAQRVFQVTGVTQDSGLSIATGSLE